jgi:arylsulfatase A-like enzyme
MLLHLLGKSITMPFGADWMHKKALFFACLLFVSLFPGCDRKQEQRFQIYRLIDHLDEQGILLSPLRREEPSEQETAFPAVSSPLLDSGSGENPFGIKRKLKMGGTERNILFCPPKTRLDYRLDRWENAVLEFGVGIVSDGQPEERRGVSFQVVLKTGERSKILFQKYVSLPEKKEVPAYSFHTIELPFIQEGMHLSLITDGNEKNASFWFNPLLYKKQETGQNVVLVSIDTLRADHLGCYGYERATSPHIDNLAAESVTFLNTYASSPWTLPSHVSLLTSLHGVHHQVYYDDDAMDPDLFTLADACRQNHLYCAAFTGGGFVSSVYGFSKGFDSYSNDAGSVFRQDSAEHLFNLVSSWLDQNKNKSFFIFLHTYQPHNPYACPYPYKTMFVREGAKWRHLDIMGYLGGAAGIFRKLTNEERLNIIGLYDGEIRYTDEKLIGPLVEKLKNLGLFDQTMFIFTSDHGEEFYDHQGWGHGHSLYDESLKVPLIIKFPDSRFAGRRIDTFVNLVDVVPTILDEFQIPFSDRKMDGRSLFPVIEGREKADRIFLADIAGNVLNSHIPQKMAMNSRKIKLILNKGYQREDLGFFLFPPPELEPVELYDLLNDPEEKQDAAEKRSRLANSLIQKINKIYKEAKKRDIRKLEIDEELKKQLKALGYIH